MLTSTDVDFGIELVIPINMSVCITSCDINKWEMNLFNHILNEWAYSKSYCVMVDYKVHQSSIKVMHSILKKAYKQDYKVHQYGYIVGWKL